MSLNDITEAQAIIADKYEPDLRLYQEWNAGRHPFQETLAAWGYHNTADDAQALTDLVEAQVNEAFYWHAVDEYFTDDEHLQDFLTHKAATDPDFLLAMAKGDYAPVEKCAAVTIGDEVIVVREDVNDVVQTLSNRHADFCADVQQFTTVREEWLAADPAEVLVSNGLFPNYYPEMRDAVAAEITDKQEMLDLIATNPRLVAKGSEALREDPEVMLAAVSQNEFVANHAGPKLQAAMQSLDPDQRNPERALNDIICAKTLRDLDVPKIAPSPKKERASGLML